MIFDTHCHYNLEPLYENWAKHWEKAQALGVIKTVIIGTDVESCQRGVEVAGKGLGSLKASLGIHPSEYQVLVEKDHLRADQISQILEEHLQALRQLRTDNPELIAAVGETGLDYFRLPSDETLQVQIKAAQTQAFLAHISLSEELDLPIIIHVRDTGEVAYRDALRILQESYHGHQPFILHCASGPLSYSKAAVDLGGYIGLAGNVTYKTAEHLRQLARAVPADRRLLETDAPFLPPQEFRGKPCEPWMITQTAEFLSDELDIETPQLYENASRVFGF